MSFVVASVFVSSNICGSLMNASYASKCADSSYGTRRRDEDESQSTTLTTGVFFLFDDMMMMMMMKEFVTLVLRDNEKM